MQENQQDIKDNTGTVIWTTTNYNNYAATVVLFYATGCMLVRCMRSQLHCQAVTDL